jgi:hypothetical protein
LTFTIAPYLLWVMLAVMLVAGLAIAGTALRAGQRRSLETGTPRSTAQKPMGGIHRHVQRPIPA